MPPSKCAAAGRRRTDKHAPVPAEDGAGRPTAVGDSLTAAEKNGRARDAMPALQSAVAALVRRFEQLKGRRASWETHWQEIADHVLPQRDFLSDTPHGQRGEKRTRRLYDSTAPMANELLASALAGMLTNPSLTWFALRTDDPDLEAKPGVADWMAAARDRMMRAFADPDANFYPQIHEVYKDLAGFGTAVFYVGDEDGRIRFQARALAELFIAEDARGRIDTVFRRYWMTARQAEQRWGAHIGEATRRALDGDPDREIAFLHAVLPASDLPRETGRKRAAMTWASLHIELDSRTLIDAGGFHEFPFMVPRWSKMVGEVYGRSPAMLALADIRMVNAMSETVLKAAQKAVDPPLQVPHDGFMTPLNLTPGAVNFYDPTAINRGGGIEPIATTGRLDLGFEMMEQRRANIRTAHLVDQLTTDAGPQQTATEVLQRTEEKMRILGPTVGRLQAELLGPVVRRAFAILERQGALPARPPALRGRPVEVEYVAPIVRRQKLSEVSGLSQMVEVVGFAAQLDPAAAQVIDAPATVRFMAEALALPASLIRPVPPSGPEDPTMAAAAGTGSPPPDGPQGDAGPPDKVPPGTAEPSAVQPPDPSAANALASMLGATPPEPSPVARLDTGPATGGPPGGAIPAELDGLIAAVAAETGLDPALLAEAARQILPDLLGGGGAPVPSPASPPAPPPVPAPIEALPGPPPEPPPPHPLPASPTRRP